VQHITIFSNNTSLIFESALPGIEGKGSNDMRHYQVYKQLFETFYSAKYEDIVRRHTIPLPARNDIPP
jgi:hypothetical protein